MKGKILLIIGSLSFAVVLASVDRPSPREYAPAKKTVETLRIVEPELAQISPADLESVVEIKRADASWIRVKYQATTFAAKRFRLETRIRGPTPDAS